MKKVLIYLMVCTGVLTVFSACNKDNDPVCEGCNEGGDSTGNGQDSAKVALLVGKIDHDRTLSADTVYVMRTYVYVVDGATLTIEPGTVILGGQESPTKGGTLFITRGSKLVAKGTADNPIVFTSEKPVGQRKSGDWGGIVFLGKASTNRDLTKRKPEGVEGADQSVDLVYGDDNNNFKDDDNSGTLEYVRVEFGGIALASTKDSEINGVTFYGVGSGTTVDHVQVSYSGDDAYEWFGGTVNVKNLVAFGTLDDNFDMDSGFRGKMQFLLALLDPTKSDVVSLSNGMEVDNLNGANTATPFTHPMISNFTLAGPGNATGDGDNFYSGARWRRGATFEVANSVYSGMPVAIDVESETAQKKLQDGTSSIKNSILQASGISPITDQRGNGSTPIGPVMFDADNKDGSILSATDICDLILKAANKNDTVSKQSDVFVNVPSVSDYKASNTDFKLKTDKAAMFDGSFNDAFFDKVNYVGAVDPADPWTAEKWINWDPQHTEYPAATQQ
ncbi:hypothetical protein [Compostibacter hankyongensis]|uniref:T9SS C-terminal target domain-containing protein n=1 Tax=Compostibacter hankyongensis TaxID=1007089 RepID=A0ABP8FER2_9BACT